jgi:eukaryotic-like serine/threonine-protein kinase
MVTGRVLGDRYRPEQVLGTGGMGAVWRGRDLRLDRPVAIKVLAGDGLTDPTAMERFDREARTVARLAHPNIVAVYDFGTEGGYPYLVMELVEGWSVAAMLTGGALALSQAVAIAAQTCDGLTAAHAAGVIHRDVKPANLILTPTGVVKICDFGIARLQHAAGQSRLTGSAEAVGSSSYMAPEQANSEPVDARTDLYGLGCTLYAMLAGGPPFAGDNPLTVVHQHLTQKPAPLATRRPDVPAPLAALVEELLAKAPADRPADAALVRTRLAAVFSDLTATPEPESDLRLTAVPQAATVADAATVRIASPMAIAAARSPGPTIPDDRPPQRSARRAWRLAALGVAALATVVSIPLLASAGCLPTTQVPPPLAVTNGVPATTSAAASRSEGPSPQRTASAQPSPSGAPRTPAQATSRPVRSSPPPPTDPIVGMRLSIQEQVATGHLNPTAAPDLYKKVDEIAKEIGEGDTDEAMKKIKELRDKLTGLRADGKLSDAGYEALVGDLNRLEATLG